MLNDIKNYFANFDGTVNSCRTVALWITVALLVAFVATKAYVFALGKRAEKYDGQTLVEVGRVVNGAWIVVALVVAVCFIAAFTSCYFADVARGDDVLVPILFYPLLALVLAVVGSAVTLFVKPNKLAKTVCAAVCGCALVAVIVCMAVYNASGEAGDALSDVGLYISAGALIVALVALAFFADRSDRPFDTRTITFAAVCVALSFALSYVRLFKMPMGGSITFASMLPLMLFAFMFGSRKGVLVGAIYGVLQAIQDPWIIHPAQFVLDYLAAFAGIGLAGCIRDLGLFKTNIRAQFALGAAVACLFRMLGHYFAGVYAFGMYGEGFATEYGMPLLANEYFYSFVYQCMYLIPELAIVVAVGMFVFASANFRKQIQTYAQRNAARNGSTEAPIAERAATAESVDASAATDDTPTDVSC